MTKNTLKKYRRKRDFKNTEEPEDGNGKGKTIFVIQKHDASTLHYDFRLSIDGALASWAVPKGLSTKAGEKQLAVRTEDHPMDYADFEGVIPEDQYGGGTVMVWDRGEYKPIAENKDHDKTMADALEDGALKFTLEGEKLKGGYALVRMDRKSKQEQWLIFKLDDEHVDARRNPVSTEPDSVLTNRSLKEIAEEEDEKDNA